MLIDTRVSLLLDSLSRAWKCMYEYKIRYTHLSIDLSIYLAIYLCIWIDILKETWIHTDTSNSNPAPQNLF